MMRARKQAVVLDLDQRGTGGSAGLRPEFKGVSAIYGRDGARPLRTLRIVVASAMVAAMSMRAAGQDGVVVGRFFFDTKGVGETEARAADDVLGFTNPTAVGEDRLYFYVELHRYDPSIGASEFSGFDFRMDITGPAEFVGADVYNRNCAGLNRWQSVEKDLAAGGQMWEFTAFRVGAGGYGVKNVPDFATVEAQDPHFRQGDDGSALGTTLLGYVDVRHTGGANTASIKFRVGGTPWIDPPIDPIDQVYFGFGDGATDYWPGRTSVLPDAFVVPEPGTVGLVVAVWLTHRRGGRKGGAIGGLRV